MLDFVRTKFLNKIKSGCLLLCYYILVLFKVFSSAEDIYCNKINMKWLTIKWMHVIEYKIK